MMQVAVLTAIARAIVSNPACMSTLFSRLYSNCYFHMTNIEFESLSPYGYTNMRSLVFDIRHNSNLPAEKRNEMKEAAIHVAQNSNYHMKGVRAAMKLEQKSKRSVARKQQYTKKDDVDICERKYQKLFQRTDINHDSFIEYEEYLGLFNGKNLSQWPATESQIDMGFSAMDEDGNGIIEEHEWLSVVSACLPFELEIGGHVIQC